MASSKTVVVFILITIFVSAWIGPSHVVSVNCFRDPKGGYTIVQGIPSSTTSSCSSANHRISCVDSSHPPHKASNGRIAGNAFYLHGYVTRFVFRCILQVLHSYTSSSPCPRMAICNSNYSRQFLTSYVEHKYLLKASQLANNYSQTNDVCMRVWLLRYKVTLQKLIRLCFEEGRLHFSGGVHCVTICN